MIINVIDFNKRFSTLDANLFNFKWGDECKKDLNLINKLIGCNNNKSLIYNIDSGYYKIDDDKIKKRVKTKGKLYIFLLINDNNKESELVFNKLNRNNKKYYSVNKKELFFKISKLNCKCFYWGRLFNASHFINYKGICYINDLKNEFDKLIILANKNIKRYSLDLTYYDCF